MCLYYTCCVACNTSLSPLPFMNHDHHEKDYQPWIRFMFIKFLFENMHTLHVHLVALKASVPICATYIFV